LRLCGECFKKKQSIFTAKDAKNAKRQNKSGEFR
jgi:hypothetical protein